MNEKAVWRRERINYYTGGLRCYRALTVEVPGRSEAFLVTRDTTPDHFQAWFRDTKQPGWESVDPEILHRARYVGYVQPIVEMIHADKTLEDKAFVV
ncbi:MAG: hypothetical protein AAFW46_18580, partial [Pseudomonadota bacterium]